jgi:hypothetical protein
MAHRLLLALVGLVSFAAAAARAAGPGEAPAPCPPAGGYQEVVCHHCRLVPETKQIKKVVYEVQEVPFCLKKLPPLLSLFHHRGCDCDQCAECDCPRYKKVLVKKEVVCCEVCASKCVVEEHVERVLCRDCPPCAGK